MSTTVRVTELKIVEFPAGYLRAYKGDDARYVAWAREYTMIIYGGRRGIVFGDGDFIDGLGARSVKFSKAALKRCFSQALKLRPGEKMIDDRTNIMLRRFGKGAAFEIDMPCGENACLKTSVLARLLKELDGI